MAENERDTKTIQKLNDAFRKTFRGGRIHVTDGVTALGQIELAAVFRKVRTFDEFNEDNDPYGEHDFGIIQHQGESIYFKIDYYDKDVQFGSENPADPKKTTRVLTILLAREY